MDRFLVKAKSDRQESELSVRQQGSEPRLLPVSRSSRAAAQSLPNEYLQTFIRHRALILCLAAAGLALAMLLQLHTPAVYRARTSLDIQGLNGDFLNIRSVDPTALITSAESNIQTQMKLLQSESLTERVKARLAAEPHQVAVKRTDLLSSVESTLHFGQAGQISFNELLDMTAKSVKVKPLGISRLVEVSCDSWDPTFAASYCNTLVSEFQAEDLESRGAQAKRTSDWLMHQAGDIREKAEEAQRKLFLATGGNGLILSQSLNSVGEDRLRQMQAELVKAQADRMEKEAQKSIASDSVANAIPNIADNPSYAASRAKLVELQNQVAALIPPLTEANPKIIHLRSEIKQVQDTMLAQQVDANRKQQNEYAAAKHREELLTLAYRNQEASVSSDLEKGSQVSLLKREMESEQELYQTLLQRAKEAGFASAMRATTIRAVDEATKPHFPVYPRRGVAAAMGLALGSLIGIAIAFYKERHMALFHAPGESQQVLQVAELAVIPSSPRKPHRIVTTPKQTDGLIAQADPAGQLGSQTACWNDSFSIVAEAYRSATLAVMMAKRSKRPSVYVVSSASSGEGKTTVISNLGIALSKSRLRVAIIDGDLRKPTLHKVLGVSNSLGFRDVLRGDVTMDDHINSFCKPTVFQRLNVIPAGSGTEEPVELLHSAHLQALLERLKEEFDIILIDTPPMLHMADARILARQSDGSILILRSAITTREEAISAQNLLLQDQIQIIGTILNDFNPSRTGKFGYYKSYYAYQNKQPGLPLVVRL